MKNERKTLKKLLTLNHLHDVFFTNDIVQIGGQTSFIILIMIYYKNILYETRLSLVFVINIIIILYEI